jgi:hypothetical protein
MMKLKCLLLSSLAVFAGCASGTLSREATLLSGLNQYQGDMLRAGGQTSRWPDRQRAAGELKAIITGMVGASSEFYRLVDLDLRKREFTVTMRENTLPADRLKEMKEELVQMEEEIAALRPVVKTQLMAIAQYATAAQMDNIAALGLLGIALDGFSSSGAARGLEGPSTKVGQYLVTDLGSFATVRSPQGQTFRCNLFGNTEEGAGMRCEPLK